MIIRLLLALSLTVPVLAVRAAGTQTAAPADTTTTASGVYTTAQATRGEETYMNTCVGCHASGTYSTDAFREKWDGHQLSELYALISENMPKQDPGSLSPKEYAQLVAYLLKINQAPVGQAELEPDVERMKKIRIEMATAKHKKD